MAKLQIKLKEYLNQCLKCSWSTDEDSQIKTVQHRAPALRNFQADGDQTVGNIQHKH